MCDNLPMIVHLHGTLEEKSPARVVIDVGGVGYEVLIPVSTYDRLPATGQTCRLLTHHEVREDAQLLFGFATEPERDMFELLMGVSGIGPKTALALISGLSVGELQLAIASSDSKRIATVKGVGKKTAERIVVELKDKVNPVEALAAGRAAEGDTARAGVLRDAMLALTALGFAEDNARQMVQTVLEADPDVSDTETVLRRALHGGGTEGKK